MSYILSMLYCTRMRSRTSRYRRKLLELYSTMIPRLVSDYDSYNPVLLDI
jgi:hypothetical protein